MHIQIVQRNSKQFQSQNKEKNAVYLFHEKKKKKFMMQLAKQEQLAKFQAFLRPQFSEP